MPDKRLVIQIELLKRFLTWDGSHWTSFIIIIAVGGLAAFSASLIPLIVGQLFTQILPGGNRQLLQSLPLILVVLLLTIVIASWSGYYVIHRLLDGLILNIRVEIFRKLLILPPACSDLPANTISLYFFESIEKLYRNTISLGICLYRDSLVAIGLFSVMIWLNPDISLLMLTVLAAALFIRQIFYANTYQRSMLDQEQHEVSRVISKTLRHSRVIFLDKGYKQEVEHIRNMFKQLQRTLLRQICQTGLLELLASIFLMGIFAGFLYYFLQQLILNQLTVEDAVAFFTAGLMLVFPLKRLSRINLLLQQCNEALHFIFSLLDRDSETTVEDTYTARIERAKGKLQLESVSYKDYQKKTWLPCFNLKIAPGKKIVLISYDTRINKLFADLICGFEQPSTGRILLDDKDINQISHAELCGNIAWITPDEDLLTDTVAANIAYGSLRCSKEIAITTAAHASQAMEFICKLPHGLQTKLKKCNVVLSDDQRQRIFIARALLKNPSIIILDESSACFDTDSAALMRALHLLLDSHTTLILSSRPVMLGLADQQLDLGNLNALSTANLTSVR
ncbi:putative ABC transport system ATP-binding protein/ATP-binding cassette, subfamily B, MsbA [Nitrosomonas eutropha]|uniref:Putative ABC transport system ATP-binding protein/ATP-binding cassette, subfamily B, MsbA n=1 Tax=Nitrosomonas eutropha TaxID=916 RepID=A0A1I7IYZ9_9PROT|nr:ATP-binding cassette domain-containing protein [Nitrosomonas eutropha]SFU78114.1 putative ABC transport system ATP-binding protein/ATP-binding cassette, subfamily B, MsbA [Nitrosomonas eutropha]